MGSAAETTVETRLYEQHSDVVYRFCLRALGSREDAEDAAQTTFFQAVRAMRRGVVPTFEQAWLLTIAKNECRSRHRANGRRRKLELVQDPQTLAEVAEAPGGSDGTLMGVQAALTRLPEMQRQALLLREWQGRSYAEIATQLGTTRPAVEALLFRARRGLARELGEETRSRRHAFDLASLLAAVKSVLGGGAAVKIAAGVMAVATVGSVAGGAEQSQTRTPAPSAKVRVQPAVAEATPTAPATRTGQAQTRRNRLADRSGSSKPTQAPTGAPGNRPGISRARETGAPSASAPTSGSPAAKPGQPSPPGQAAASPIAPPSVPAPSAPPAPTLPDLPGVPELPTVELPKVELPKVEVPQLPQVPELPQVPQLPQLPQLPEVPQLPDVPVVPELPILP